MLITRFWKVVIVLLIVDMPAFSWAQIQLFPQDTTLCPGEGVTFVANNNCNGNVSFSWYVNGNFVITNASGVFSYLPSQPSHQIMLVSECEINGTLTVDTVQTTVYVHQIAIDAGPDQFVDSGTMVTLQAQGMYDSLTWTPSYLVNYPFLPTVQTTPSQTTTYMLQAYAAGCFVYDYVTVYITNVFDTSRQLFSRDV